MESRDDSLGVSVRMQWAALVNCVETGILLSLTDLTYDT